MTTGLDRLAVGFEGLVYRAHHPGWAYQPTSGEGAERHGGRFNRKGLTALYTSLDITTAWMEAHRASLAPEPGALALGRWAALLSQRHR